MGGLANLRKHLRERFAKYARGNGFHDTGMPSVANRAVVVSDDLTRMHRFSTAHPEGLTGTELFAQWIQVIDAAFQSGTVSTYVAVYDRQNLMPPEKHSEQKKRREDHVPYHSVSTFCDAGICEPVLETDGSVRCRMVTVVDEDGVEREEKEVVFLLPVRININRLLQTTCLRLRLFRYIMDKLVGWPVPCNRKTETPTPVRLPPDTQIIVDAGGKGPVIYRGDGKLRQLHAIRRTLGEADLQVLWWARQIPERIPVFVESVDCDLMVLLTWFYENTRRANLYWVFSLGAYMDVAVFWDCVQSFMRGKSIRHFVRACCACGNDFVEKKQLFNYFNEENILDSAPYTTTGPHLVRHAYTHKLKKTSAGERGTVLELDAIAQLCSDSARYKVPRLEDPIWERLEWNVAYWCHDWEAEPVHPALKEFRW
jgi:hypothetical protein